MYLKTLTQNENLVIPSDLYKSKGVAILKRLYVPLSENGGLTKQTSCLAFPLYYLFYLESLFLPYSTRKLLFNAELTDRIK